jgi:uncharacterized protein
MLSGKIKSIQTLLTSYGSILIALSGGVDSSVLLKLAVDCLSRGQVLAATAHSEISTLKELELATQVAQICKVDHKIVFLSELEMPEFVANPPERCYYCKLKRFQLLQKLATQQGLQIVADGSNQSDQGDYRPGMKALTELGIRSPLLECGFTKDEIRGLAKDLGLPNWNQPSNACLASRFPYGTPITAENLSQVAQGEKLLHSFGLTDCRLRHHGTIARIEVPPTHFSIFLDQPRGQSVVASIKSLGFTYVTLDLQGYRTGSLNEVI